MWHAFIFAERTARTKRSVADEHEDGAQQEGVLYAVRARCVRCASHAPEACVYPADDWSRTPPPPLQVPFRSEGFKDISVAVLDPL